MDMNSPAIEVIGNKRCTGCFGCCNACPVGAISMNLDAEGFYMPVIDKNKCIRCGLCQNFCPVIEKAKRDDLKPIYFAFKTKGEKLIRESSSGGFWGEAAKYLIERDYKVYGAGFDKTWKVKHICINSSRDLDNTKGSKYLQSNVGNTYKNIRKQLSEGKRVAFSGTPCQIAALNKLVSHSDKNKSLLTLEVVCHGVNSISVWEKYLRYLEDKYTSPITSVSFRNKREGWVNYSMSVKFESGKVLRETLNENQYLRIFLKDVALRESCYDCEFDSVPRQADITMGDLWGGGRNLYNHLGLSVIGVNTSKGNSFFEDLVNSCDCTTEVVEKELVRKRNPRLKGHGVKRPSERGQLSSVRKSPFHEISKRFLKKKNFSVDIKKMMTMRLKTIYRKFFWPKF